MVLRASRNTSKRASRLGNQSEANGPLLLGAIAVRVEAIATRVEAITTRVEAIAIRLDGGGSESRQDNLG